MEKQHRCTGCNSPLTPAERHYYGGSCDRCEREETEHLDDWQNGRIADPQLDQLYAVETEDLSLH